MYGYIYETTNNVNGKKYIGKRVSNIYDKYYLGSGLLLQKALDKYGRENFSQVILEECYSNDELNACEKKWIKTRNATSSPDYYNIAEGGDGGNLIAGYSEEELIERNALISKRTKQRMLELGITTENGLSDKIRSKISKATKGVPKSECMKKKLSESTRGVPKLYLKGKHWSDEHRKNMSEFCKKNNQIHNITNTNKGKKMINKDGVIKYVNVDELQSYLDKGWNRGTNRKQDSKGRFI